jgi:hypothetical protein
MPHFKCVACKTRLYTATSARDDVVDLCPGCGELLEPVGELAEIVGFQSVRPRDGAAGRWLDDGGGLRAESVALPRPETSS